MFTCLHCGEPIDHAQGVWFHPRRRFRGCGETLPTLCDFGYQLGPTHATPIALTPRDKDFLYSIHVAIDEESFLLEALWLDWRNMNIQRGATACAECGAAVNGQHSMSCKRRALMAFDGVLVQRKCIVPR
ncbi:MAG: hypothetical protein ACRD4R_00520 [Candidatus Acidiferrales bacterium]